jgi:hypothetical protein
MAEAKYVVLLTEEPWTETRFIHYPTARRFLEATWKQGFGAALCPLPQPGLPVDPIATPTGLAHGEYRDGEVITHRCPMIGEA